MAHRGILISPERATIEEIEVPDPEQPSLWPDMIAHMIGSRTGTEEIWLDGTDDLLFVETDPFTSRDGVSQWSTSLFGSQIISGRGLILRVSGEVIQGSSMLISTLQPTIRFWP